MDISTLPRGRLPAKLFLLKHELLRRKMCKLFSVTIYHPTAFGAVKQHDLLGGRGRPGAQMKAHEFCFSNQRPDFQEDLLVAELFHEVRRE